MTAPAEPEPAAQESSGGKMSQDDIEKLLAATLGGEAEPEIVEDNAPETPVEDTPAEPAPAESSGGKMSQEDIEALLNSMQDEANK